MTMMSSSMELVVNVCKTKAFMDEHEGFFLANKAESSFFLKDGQGWGLKEKIRGIIIKLCVGAEKNRISESVLHRYFYFCAQKCY